MAAAIQSGPSELRAARRAMACDFTVVLPGGVAWPVDAACAALDEVDRLEAKLSVFLEASELVRVNREASSRPVPVDAELFDLLELASALSRATGGAFDAATGALLRAWGFQGGERRVPTGEALALARSRSGGVHVTLDPAARTVAFDSPGVEFNLGALGKGYAIDRAARVLRSGFGIRAALVGGGQSSLRALGAPWGEPRGWGIDIGDPAGGAAPMARVWLRDRALGTSGAANQYFIAGGRRYGHILDPRSGRPAHALASATAVARTAAEADALSTAFYVMGAEAVRRFCRRHPEVGALLVHAGTNPNAPRVELAGAIQAEVLL
jgi:thiamine biosynthesis lipoprotein